MSKKKCSHCGEIKSTSKFHKSKVDSTGFCSFCKVCKKTTARTYPSQDTGSKQCIKCCQELPLTAYSKDKYKKDGRTTTCVPCRQEYLRGKRESKKLTPKEKECSSCKTTKTSTEFRRCSITSTGLYSQCKECSSEYQKANPANLRARQGKRRSKKIQRTPSWLTAEDFNIIKGIYLACAEVTNKTGIQHHVDHIIPLQGKLVSGLHVPDNLQIISATDNFRKSNKYLV